MEKEDIGEGEAERGVRGRKGGDRGRGGGGRGMGRREE